LVEKYTQENVKKNIENQDRIDKLDNLTCEITYFSKKDVFLFLNKEDRKKKNEEERNKKKQELDDKVKEMTDSQKEYFFSENIKILNTEIELLLKEKHIHKKS